MKIWLLLLLLYPLVCFAQTYQYLSVEDGLSNRRVYCIQKDHIGYMWFLTHEGIDRYNGKEFKEYKLMDKKEEVNSSLNLNWLFIDKEGVLWITGKKGKIFRYDRIYDQYKIVFKLPQKASDHLFAPITSSFIDKGSNIWLCSDQTIYLYNSKTEKSKQIKNNVGKSITAIVEVDSTHFYIGNDQGICYAEFKNNSLEILYNKKLDDKNIQINEFYFDPIQRKLFIGTFQRGIFIYDIVTKQIHQPEYNLSDVNITCIKPFNNQELLIATDGAGIYKLNKNSHQIESYIRADYNSYNGMNGNSINDIYIDNEQRIWMANYPIGVTIRNSRYASYNWIRHSIGNKQSLVNDQINSILEDQDGDLWFATTNGISWYEAKNQRWNSFLSSFDNSVNNKNHIFTCLSEIRPGVIWAGGYSSGIYEINKKNRQVSFFTPSAFSNQPIFPDKYIKDIEKDSQGSIWAGGYYNLKRIDLKNKHIQLYPGLSTITSILERNADEMWIGTATCLYLLDKESGKFQHIKLPIGPSYIYSLYQAKNGLLYIGTSGYGLFIYDHNKKSIKHYHVNNCAMISNNIYAILSDSDKNIILSTENGLTSFDPQQKVFRNWTKEQGLMSTHFNAMSGTLRHNNKFIFGSSNGAIEFNKDMKLPQTFSSKMLFSDFKLFYQTVYPGDKGSPLEQDINETQSLHLNYNQNIFSFRVSSINYDYPSNILYSWKLEGFYDAWSRPESEDIIQFTNLNPGKYILKVRAISKEDNNVVLQERQMEIIIDYPFWLSIWAMILYTITLFLISSIIYRVFTLRKQRKVSKDKINFFINTAHDIRTPLTLIKAPLEELMEKENLSKDGEANMNTALRNVNTLLRLTTNLINFEKADIYSSELYISENEINTFMHETIDSYRQYADMKHISITYESNFHYCNVWFDKEKMESILKNIISNALKYTPENGSVAIFAKESAENWSIEVSDTGIGIPSNEQKNLFKLHFRGSNAVNAKIAGSGIGLLLVWKLVQLHKGKITMNSIENEGSLIKIVFPKNHKSFRKAHIVASNLNQHKGATNNDASLEHYDAAQQRIIENRQRILIVEDNDELRNYLQRTLSETYTVQTCTNGKEAISVLNSYHPELIISDIMMPEMRGDELCAILKNDIETSHIPIILLTALNDEKNIIAGLEIGADRYIVKPFNIGILKATIANLIANRLLLRQKFATGEVSDEIEDNSHTSYTNDIDHKFMSMVKECIENNMDNSSFTVDVLCGELNMSRTSFYNKLKALTDQAPADFIRVIRLKRAAQLLKEGQYNITEIADMTGFSDAKYFREVFKKHFKMSPSKYSKEG